jgi:signal transduction histidine kinase
MGPDGGGIAHFRLFDSAGVGLIGLDEHNVVLHVNDSFLRYLDLATSDVLGQDAPSLRKAVSSPEFWNSLAERVSFYALIPGTHHLLLGMALPYGSDAEPALRKIVQLRPYSLEREFMRMRSRLNQNVAFEISEHLSSIAVAGEIILQPDLQQDEATKDRFLKTFLGDIQDLSGLFSELQDIAEPVPFPNKVHFGRVDFRGLLADLLAKLKGFVGERNVSISSSLSGEIPPVEGDHHWLSLAMYGIVKEVVVEAPALGEVSVHCAARDGTVETTIALHGAARRSDDSDWPPRTLYPLSDDDPRIGKMPFSDLAVSRCIIGIHRGEEE